MKRIQNAWRWALPVALTFTIAGPVRAQGDTSVLIRMTEIKIHKEDDPLSNDEPYLLNIGFKGQIAVGADSVPSLVADTLRVVALGKTAHHNLGRAKDNWANRGGTYPFDTQMYGAVIPSGQSGWIVGIVSVLMEEDAYSDGTAMDLRNKVRDAVSEALTKLEFDSVDAGGISQTVCSRVVRDLQRATSKMNIAGILKGLASAVDPDDFGGVNVVIAMTMPQNGLMMFAGAPPDNLGELPTLTLVPAGGQTPFSLEFPMKIPGGVLWNGRYRGKCKVSGAVIRGS